jgi:hypothetical protein
MFEEEGETFGSMKKRGGRGKFPQWAIWTIVAVCIVAIIGITVAVTLVLSGGGETNRAPVISTFTAVPPVVSPGGYSTITCVASDPEGETVSYTWTATGGTVSGIGSVVSWIAPNVAGTFSVGVSVSDGERVTNSSISVTVSSATPTPTPTRTATPTPTSTPTATSVSTPTAVPSYGSISINSTPSGAAIYIDGVEDSNVTPYTMIHVAAGNHSVRLVYPGYWREGNVSVYSGETSEINWVLYTVHDEEFDTAGRDAYVNKSEPDANYGTETALSVAGNSTRIFAQFNLSSIPSTAVILSANLSLFYYDNESTATSGYIGVYRVTGSWDESTITWNTSPATQSTSIATIMVSPAAIGDFLTWNVSSLVRGWVNGPITNYGLTLRDTNEATSEGYKLFYSSDAAAHHPKLAVSYYDPAE